MEVGQTLDVHLMPEEAYGLADPDAIFTVELAQLPWAEELEAGQQVTLPDIWVKVVEKDENNHYIWCKSWDGRKRIEFYNWTGLVEE